VLPEAVVVLPEAVVVLPEAVLFLWAQSRMLSQLVTLKLPEMFSLNLSMPIFFRL
jgi:hypothetical protein